MRIRFLRIRAPEWYLLYAVTFYLLGVVWPTPYKVGEVGLMFAMAIAWMPKHNLHIAKLRAGAPWLLFALLAFVSVLWSIDRALTMTSLLGFTRMTLALVVSLLCLDALDRRRLTRLAAWSVIGATASATYIVARYGTLRSFGRVDSSVQFLSNLTAFVAVTALPLLLFGGKWQPGGRLARWILAVLAILIVAASESRAAIGLLVFEGVAVTFGSLKNPGRIVRGLVLASAAGAISVFAANHILGYNVVVQFTQRLESSRLVGNLVGTTVNSQNHDIVRLTVLRGEVRLAAELPVLGIGWGAFPTWLQRRTGIRMTSHDFFAAAYCELGILGLLLALWLGWAAVTRPLSAARRLRQGNRPDDARALQMLSLSVAAGFGFQLVGFTVGNPLWFILVGSALASRTTDPASDNFDGASPQPKPALSDELLQAG